MKEKQSLFDRAYQLEKEILVLKEDLVELKGEFTFDKEYNTDAFPKAEVKEVMDAAKAKATQDDLKAKADKFTKLQEVMDLYSE